MSGSEALYTLLLAMPADGSWMIGTGIHSPTLMILLDEESPYIEENVMPDDETKQVEWMVRLTAAGMKVLAALPRDQDNSPRL